MTGSVRGRLFLLGSAVFLSLVFYGEWISSRKLKKIIKDPTIMQYLNRLVEFFDDYELPMAQDQFMSMVDLGIYPKEAFGLIIFNGELN